MKLPYPDTRSLVKLFRPAVETANYSAKHAVPLCTPRINCRNACDCAFGKYALPETIHSNNRVFRIHLNAFNDAVQLKCPVTPLISTLPASYLTLLQSAFLRREFFEYFKHFLNFSEAQRVLPSFCNRKSFSRVKQAYSGFALRILLMIRTTTFFHLALFKKESTSRGKSKTSGKENEQFVPQLFDRLHFFKRLKSSAASFQYKRSKHFMEDI